MGVGIAAKTDALARFLTETADARAARITAFEHLGGGAVQENWSFEVEIDGGPMTGHHALVLRTSAPAAIPLSHDRETEFRLLEAAHQAGVAVPEPLFFCSNPEVIGRTFSLVRRVAGLALGSRVIRAATRNGWGQAVARQLGRELARIHAITSRSPRIENLVGPPPADPARDTIAAYSDYLDGCRDAHPVLEWGLRWCARRVPDPSDVVLCHRDFRTGNYLVDDGRLAAILDWEFAGWGDPAEDLGWFCTKSWRFGANRLAAGGLAPREPFVEAYEQASGRRLNADAMSFWEVMANIRWAVIALQQCERHLSGAEASLELTLIGRRLPEIEHEILTLTAKAQRGSLG